MNDGLTTEQIETWRRMARELYPGYTDRELDQYRISCVVEWAYGRNTDNAALYEQFRVMKELVRK